MVVSPTSLTHLHRDTHARAYTQKHRDTQRHIPTQTHRYTQTHIDTHNLLSHAYTHTETHTHTDTYTHIHTVFGNSKSRLIILLFDYTILKLLAVPLHP